MDIISNRPVMIFKRDNKYNVGISRKKKDGSYETAYMKIEFNKGTELEDRQLITIKKAWLDFYNWEYEGKKGTTWCIRCSEFETTNNENNQEEIENPYAEMNTKTENDIGVQIEITDDDLPF